MFALSHLRLQQLISGCGRSVVQARRNASDIVRQPILSRHLEFLDSSLPNNQDFENAFENALEGLRIVAGLARIKQLLWNAPNNRKKIQSDILTWKNIKRGRDVFVPGLQAFNITDVYNRVVQQQHEIFARDLLECVFRKPEVAELCKKVDSGARRKSKTKGENLDWLLKHDAFDLFSAIEAMVVEGSLERSYESDKLRQYIKSGIRPWYWVSTMSAAYWMVSLEQLQAFGHFQNAFHSMKADRSMGTPLSDLERENDNRTLRLLVALLSTDEKCPQRRHLIRYQRYWNDLNTIGSLHEIAEEAVQWSVNNSKDYIDLGWGYSSRRTLFYDWPEGGDEMHPNQLLNVLREAKAERELGAEVKYPYLENAPDDGNISLLRSNYEIRKVADALHNCASMYAVDVEQKEMLLAVLKDPTSGKPMASGSVDLERSEWSEIKECNNREPSQDIIEQFNRYLNFLKKSLWYRDLISKLSHDIEERQGF